MKDNVQQQSYRIHELQCENFKRLRAVTIKPDGSLVEITGRNGQGKTSCLDAIVAAIGGKGRIQKIPLRKGATEGKIKIDLGDIIVTRTFEMKDGEEATTHLTVEGADGRAYRSPQAVLDDLMGDLAFDPLEFTRLEPKQQFDLAKQFVPEIDFDAIARADKEDRDDRTLIGRRQRQAEGAAKAVIVPDAELLPDDPIDMDALLREHSAAVEHNRIVQNANDMLDRAEKMRADAVKLEEEANNMLRKLDTPEPVDVAVIQERGKEARAINELVALKKQKLQHQQEATRLEVEYTAISDRIAERQRDKEAAIAKAELPVEGLSFGDGVVLYGGLPFDQASSAEQIRISTAIAMSLNPKLKVILIRDGSLLDKDSRAMLSQIAEKNDYQVFLECVATDKKCGVIIEDGRVVSG